MDYGLLLPVQSAANAAEAEACTTNYAWATELSSSKNTTSMKRDTARNTPAIALDHALFIVHRSSLTIIGTDYWLPTTGF